MKHLILAIVLSLAGRVWADDKEDLAAAAKKTAESKSYSFKGETKTEMPAFGGQGGGAQDPQKFEGKHEEGVGTHILTDQQEIVKVGAKTASRPRAEWRVTDETQQGQGGGRGAGGRGMAGMMGRGSTKAPHEDFKDFGAKLAKASKSDKKETVGETECDVYSIELTEDAVKAMLPGGGMFGRMGQNAEITYTGTGKVFVADGVILKYVLKAVVSASIQGNDVELTIERTTMIYDIDKTKVELPADAKKAIDKASD